MMQIEDSEAISQYFKKNDGPNDSLILGNKDNLISEEDLLSNQERFSRLIQAQDVFDTENEHENRLELM